MLKIKTIKQFEDAFSKLVDEISSREIFLDNTESAKKERIEKSRKDILYFGKTYFTEYFRDKSPSFQKEWKKIKDIKNEPVLVMASRGFGKSTFFTFLDIVYRVIFGVDRFIVIGCYVVDKAAIFTSRILIELTYNQKIINDFGDIINNVKFKNKRSYKHWSARSPITKERIDVKAFSIGQDPRGIVNGAYRPSCVRLDDIQSSKRAKSRKFVSESINWIFESLIPALEDNYSLIILATPLNNKCVASTLKNGDENKRIKKIKTFEYPAINKNGRPLWEARFPLSRLEKLKSIIPVEIFDQEFILKPRKIEDRIFDTELFKKFYLNDILKIRFDLIVSATDFSLTANGDYKATVCVGFFEGKIYILKVRIRKERVDLHIKGMYQLNKDYYNEKMFYEDVTINKDNISSLAESFEYIAKEKGYPLPIEPVRNLSNKIVRISSGLSTLLNNGEILFNIDDPEQKILIEQLEDFPDGDNDDGPDALEMVVSKGIEILKFKNIICNKPVVIPKKGIINWEGY